jgi:hypothetical protein
VKRIAMLSIAVGAFALWAQSAGAQTPTTLSFFEPATGGAFKIIDTAPRSPVKNPESRKYRFSVGDVLIFSEPVFDHKGGTRVATLHGVATVIKGTRFSNLTVMSDVGYVFFGSGDQLMAQGVFSFATDVRIPIVGGTGAYQGAHGFVVSHNNSDGSSQDTVTLLP